MGLVRVSDKNREEFLAQIVRLESEAEYPLGNDYFKIDHGGDYFKFFNRLGDVHYYTWVDGGHVAAVGAGILRKVPLKRNQLARVWYLSDLKVRKDFRGQKIPLRMLTRAFLPNYFRCQRGYAISMNSSGEQKNRVARLLEHFRWVPIKEVTKLLIWSLSQSQMKRVEHIVQKYRGPVTYLSLRGVKDIVLRSTNEPMPLVHVQFGPLADPSSLREAEVGAVHMFCSPENDPLTREILASGFAPSSTASVIAHRMKESDWTWVLTSDI